MKSDRRWWNDGVYERALEAYREDMDRSRATIAILRRLDGTLLLVPLVFEPAVLHMCGLEPVEVELRRLEPIDGLELEKVD